MNKIDHGGYVYPSSENDYNSGLNLREHFSGVALAGLLARKVAAPAADLAAQAYELADALIAARNKPAVSEREKLLGVIADITTEAATAASVMTDDQLRAVLVRIDRLGNDAIREARGM